MRVVMFYHSLLSDWNHGNAHFLRGVVSDLIVGGNDVDVYEPRDSWSRKNLVAEHGEAPVEAFRESYPSLDSILYDAATVDLDRALDGADVVIVHEWNDHELVAAIGEHRRRAGNYRLYFHDTHHRAVSKPQEIREYDLSGYDGVLAFGKVIRDLYLSNGWAQNAWTWHEAADVRVFYPHEPDGNAPVYDLVWIGNWGDDERSDEIREYLIEPVKQLGLKALVHGVRYPKDALQELADARIEYRGWLPNFEAPRVFANAKLTVHIPRRPYVESLPGIPTIRPFEAMACGVPLVSAWWEDAEGLFTPGEDLVMVNSGDEMTAAIGGLLADDERRLHLAAHARETILAMHTCSHRVDELLAIDADLSKAQKQKVMTA
jgi:spore maturation protein CgeB